MIVEKSQIRPRSDRVRLSNAEILLADTTGIFTLIPGPAIGFTFELTRVRFISNIVQAYGNIDATNPFMQVSSGFYNSGFLEDTATGPNCFTVLFSFTGPFQSVPVTADLLTTETTFKDVDPNGTFTGTLADLAKDITLLFDNGGADLNGGDPANYLDIFVDYNILKVSL